METQNPQVQIKAKSRRHSKTRLIRRRFQRETVRQLARPFARFRSGVRTGITPHFAVWMADLRMKSALQRTSLASLADRHDSAVLAGTYGMLHVGGFRSVWDLTQADARDLLCVKGIGPKRLEDVKRDLVTRHVAVRW